MFRAAHVALFLLLFSFATTLTANADSVVLTFEGIKEGSVVGNHYIQYGITFSNNATTSISELNGGSGNFVPTPPGFTSLGLTSGTAITMDVARGFTSSLSFDYLAGLQGSVTLYSGLNGTGSIVGTMVLPVTPTCSSGPTYCQWLPVTIDFSGTAMSAVFGGQHLYFVVDNIALQTSKVAVVPEPSSLLLISTGIAGIVFRKRQLRKYW